MKFSADSHVSHRMNPNEFDDCTASLNHCWMINEIRYMHSWPLQDDIGFMTFTLINSSVAPAVLGTVLELVPFKKC